MLPPLVTSEQAAELGFTVDTFALQDASMRLRLEAGRPVASPTPDLVVFAVCKIAKRIQDEPDELRQGRQSTSESAGSESSGGTFGMDAFRGSDHLRSGEIEMIRRLFPYVGRTIVSA